MMTEGREGVSVYSEKSYIKLAAVLLCLWKCNKSCASLPFF